MRFLSIPSVKSFSFNEDSFVLDNSKLLIPSLSFASSAKFFIKEVEKETALSMSYTLSPKSEDISISVCLVEGYDKEAYSIKIDCTGVLVEASSEAGAFYALMTILQMLGQFGCVLPFGEISDNSDLSVRGFYHDITRGKVPTLQTMKELAEFCAKVKINHLELYVEHVFEFSFLKDARLHSDYISAEEIFELDQYCKALHIDLVPSLATFGHMFEILESRKYSHLKEIDNPYPDWAADKMLKTWFARMQHHTIDVTSEESYILLEMMLDEYLPLFSSEYFNVCADETFDLGKGKNKEYVEEKGAGEVYLTHILKLYNIVVKKHGKTMLMWGDIILEHPALLSRLPKDIIVLNWNYKPDVPESQTEKFAQSGYMQYVCPGIHGWNKFINDNLAGAANISKSAYYAKKYKAAGLLNTNWGDYGHINFLSAAYYGIAYGAAVSWGEISQSDFENALSLLLWKDSSNTIAPLLGSLSVPQRWDQFNFLLQNLIEDYTGRGAKDKHFAVPLDSEKYLLDSLNTIDSAIKEVSSLPLAFPDKRDLAEIRTSLKGSRASVLRLLIAYHHMHGNIEKRGEYIELFVSLMDTLAGEYTRLWRFRNKESELHSIIRAFNEATKEVVALT